MTAPLCLLYALWTAIVSAAAVPHDATGSASTFAGSTVTAVFPPPDATDTSVDAFFPDASQVGHAGPTPSTFSRLLFRGFILTSIIQQGMKPGYFRQPPRLLLRRTFIRWSQHRSPRSPEYKTPHLLYRHLFNLFGTGGL